MEAYDSQERSSQAGEVPLVVKYFLVTLSIMTVGAFGFAIANSLDIQLLSTELSQLKATIGGGSVLR